MTGILLGISMFLHIVTFFIIILLYLHIRERKALNSDNMKREVDELLQSYLADIRAENDRLIEKMSEDSSPNEENESSYFEETSSPVTEQNGQEETVWMPPVAEIEEEPSPSVTAQALYLQEQGYSPIEIAKQLNKGAGEIELLLKLHKKM
ncbi:DUF6115 domain-containing protein [Tuberibacillus sp. Marseille-P3662]|uniref:DUF6115 domain-containing protein n=1 Tax=Tuberibacillus sp. Marseille-P3662 TaxID=1965358 RepID=UPI000A1CCD2F|nr:hypothetical protein [Tuberibacillus sp. Marseille-P3662]